MIHISKDANPNYLCKIVEIKNLRKHTNADRLLVFNVDGNDIITSNSTVEGTLGVYFPLECQINSEYLKLNNEFSNAVLNEDPTAKGYFSDNGRVKATRLRGEKSMGYVAPIDSLEKLIGPNYLKLKDELGKEFDMIGDIKLVKKFVIQKTPGSGLGGGNKQPKSTKVSKLIDNQFRLHYDTVQLAKNIHRLRPESIVSLTWKFHGTSFVSSKVLCKRPLKWYERFAKWIGLRIEDKHYDSIYSSRKVIKNGFIINNPNHYYGYDLWEDINKQFQADLLDGESIYGEAVGYTRDGGFIQKGYDYGCKQGDYEIYIYRITQTSPSGRVIDLPFNMVQERAKQLNKHAVPYIYFGQAQHLVPFEDFEDIRDWQEAVLDYLKVRYVHDQDCQFCKTKVPAEGVVLRIEGLVPEAFKLKAFRFLERETKELDKGEENIEDQTDETETGTNI